MKGHLKRELAEWDARQFDSVDSAERSLTGIFSGTIDKYVKMRTPRQPKTVAWWDKRCERAWILKAKAFKKRHKCPRAYVSAKRSNKRAQSAAYIAYQAVVKIKLLESSNSSRDFWSLSKDIAGLNRAHNSAAPSVHEIATHFSDKMSIEQVLDSKQYHAPTLSGGIVINKWTVSYKRVLKVLSSLNVNKSVNGISPRFLRECAL